MPPRAPIIVQPSPSPPPAITNDAHDILVIQDIMDTLDQIPNELTRVHSDLNELGAVLYSTLLNLEKKLHLLIDWIQDGAIGPEKRFQLLQEIAEEAARYKLGGDDKIRVAGGACDGIMSHQRHISNLLAASTLLTPTPLSPYSQSLTLAHALPTSNTRRGVLARAANSPFGMRPTLGVASGSGEGRIGDTPTKKKKSRVQQLNVAGRDDDEGSMAGKGGKGFLNKKKRVHRAISPTDSLGSNSAFMGKPTQPQTARQMAAAANRARKVERADDSEDESGEEDKRDALGLDMGHGSREGSHLGRNTPIIGNNGNGRGGRMRAGVKRQRGDDEDDDESEGEDDERPPVKRTGTGGNGQKKASNEPLEPAMLDEGAGMEADGDGQLYCTCQRGSFGEMIGCDSENCPYEWFHLGCIGLDKLPAGNWICDECAEKNKKGAKAKKGGKPKAKK